MAGATVIIHAAGWLEGGLTVSYEKLITDMEVLQMVAELCAAGETAGADLGREAIADVQPGGHFFGTPHTMERYQSEFYEPLVADYSNYGTWQERGEVDATTRATGIWQDILAQPNSVKVDDTALGGLKDYIAKATEAGGAAPVS